MRKIVRFFVVLAVCSLALPSLGLAQYLDPTFPPTLQAGPFPFGTETVRGDAPVDGSDPNEVTHEYTAYKGTVMVDGDLTDAAWANIPWTLMEFHLEVVGSKEGSLWDAGYAPELWDGWEDCTAWFKMIHDDANIYVAIMRYDDDYNFDPTTYDNNGNIWQNDAYQIIIDTRFPGDFEEEMPGAEIGVCLIDNEEAYNWWSTGYQNPATQLELAAGDCPSSMTSAAGKAIHGKIEDAGTWFKETMEMAFVKYPEMSDDMAGMLSICALDRDFDTRECVLQWAQGLYAKDSNQYGSVFWSSQPVPVSAVDNKVEKPTAFALQQNYPNPFNPVTRIDYTLAKAENISLTVYTLDGRLVATLLDNESKSAGEYSATFNASDLSSGVYLYKLQTASQTLVQKMTLLK